MIQRYVAMWVPAESLSSCQEHGAMLLEPSDILPDQADSTRGSLSKQEPIFKQNSGISGDEGDLDVIVMISLSQATTQELETLLEPNAPAETPSCGKGLRLAWSQSQDDMRLRQLDTYVQSTSGEE